MKNFQTKLDVIGNNIANVNTYGFKKGRVIFKDMISQSAGGASAATATRGGINPKQVGLGSQIASIDTIQTGGNTQSTGRVLDLAIAGDGYFVVAEGKTNGTQKDIGTDLSYTRAGNLYLDNEGYLLNSDGLYIAGVAVAGTHPNYTVPAVNNTNSNKTLLKIPTDATSMSIGVDGTVTYIAGSDTGTGTGSVKKGDLVTVGRIVLAKFSNSGGLEKAGSNLFKENSNSGKPTFDFATGSGLGTIQSNMLEMSNVDLSEEFTEMIVAQRGFQANTRIITTSDEILQELVNLKR